jgi:hypothetical protein
MWPFNLLIGWAFVITTMYLSAEVLAPARVVLIVPKNVTQPQFDHSQDARNARNTLPPRLQAIVQSNIS